MIKRQLSQAVHPHSGLEIEKNADACGHGFLPNAAKAGAEIVDLHSPGNMRPPLEVYTSATHDAEGVERRRADALIESVVCATGQEVRPRLNLSSALTHMRSAAIEHEMLTVRWTNSAKRSGDGAFKSEPTVTKPPSHGGVNSV